MPILEAISHFVDANGRWPSYETILKFINMAGIVVESPRRAWDDAGSTAEMMNAPASTGPAVGSTAQLVTARGRAGHGPASRSGSPKVGSRER